ncbi:MAG: hypothetical protein OXB97_08530 [Rhodospirillales bacterium]|nr:hypothetical protein [Rhodospirillales bacterium]
MTIELPGRAADLTIADSLLVGARSVADMRARLDGLRGTIEAQGERVTAAGAVVERRRQALAEAEGVLERERAALAHLCRAERGAEGAIEAKRERAALDREAAARIEREAEAARQRAIEDGLVAFGRQARA